MTFHFTDWNNKLCGDFVPEIRSSQALFILGIYKYNSALDKLLYYIY